jgi:hypothetical protein
MESVAAWLAFFAAPSGISVVGVVVAAVVILWEWRAALLGLCMVQLGVAVATVVRHDMPAEWGAIMVGVMALSALILALSARQTHARASLYQSGTWSQRGLLLLLVYASWRLLDWHLPLPQIDPLLADLFLWMALCVLMILGMSENPLFTAVAILLWLIPAQAVTAALLGIPALVALVGMVQLLAALACSYLILVEEAPAEAAPVITDITFPVEGAGSLMLPKTPEPVAMPSLLDWLRGRWAERMPRDDDEAPDQTPDDAANDTVEPARPAVRRHT